MTTINYKHCAVVPSYLQGICPKNSSKAVVLETRDSNVPYMYVGVCLFTKKKHFMVPLWHIQIASITPLVLYGSY